MLRIYTQGGGSFGMGHLYRARWLAAVLREQSWCGPAEVCADAPDLPADWFGATAKLVQLRRDGSSLSSSGLGGTDIAVVDWLDSDPQEMTALAERCHLVLLDDYGPAAELAELTVNALLAPLDASETFADSGRILSGVRYVQLNPQVTLLRHVGTALGRAMQTELAAPLEAQPVRSLLVSFSEADPDDLDSTLAALAELGYDGRVLVMPARTGLSVPAGLDAELIPRGGHLPDLLASADVVVCNDGFTLYEAAYLGVPAVTLPFWPTGAKLAAAGTCLVAGWPEERGRHVSQHNSAGVPLALQDALGRLLSDAALRGRMSAAGMRLIDGHGLQRTVDAIAELR